MVYLSQGSYQTKPGNSPYRNVEHIIKSKISTNPKTFENVYKKTILEWKTLNSSGDSTDEQDEEINFLADFFEKWKSANTGKSYENISGWPHEVYIGESEGEIKIPVKFPFQKILRLKI